MHTLKDRILPLRQQATQRNDWLRQRLDTVIPEVMAREDIAMWIISAREYNEDPVIMSMLPEPSMSARRRTILIFARNADGSVDRLTLHRYGYGDLYQPAWNADTEGQFEALQRVVAERDPATIALNTSATFAFGDGLTHHEYGLISAALGSDYMARVVSGERLCVGWLERRIPAEMAAYPGIVQIGHEIIRRAFSTDVIHAGITTTQDVVWWMRETISALGLRAWFQPDVEIQAPGQAYDYMHEGHAKRREVIMPGDLLWCDMGFYYLGLATDQQQHAYVLHPGKTDAPAGIKAALAQANQLQDILLRQMQVGRSGNAILKAARAEAEAAGLRASIYSHPLGYHGHAAGPTIGLWDQQAGVPGNGDYELFADTAYSIELNVLYDLPEWDGQTIRIALEEDALLTGGGVQWLDDRQTTLHLIG